MDIRGEPKFYTPYGEVYDQYVNRPQNDGPGVEVIPLINYANLLLDN